MKNHILIVNLNRSSIPDLKFSRFRAQTSFKQLTPCQPFTLEPNEIVPDLMVVSIDPTKDDHLALIAAIRKSLPETEIITAINQDHARLGVQTLKNGASDFMILPADAACFDFYITRALEREYQKKHLCFNKSCYKSRYASSEKNYKQLFDEVPCFVYVQDRDYHIVDSNKKFKEYFGNHIGEYCFGICKNRDDPCRICPVDKTFKEGKNHSSETQIISSFGLKHTVLHWTAPIRDDQGRTTKVLVMLTDITEVRHLEDHLTSLGFMIGSISHGVKGLLTGLDSGIYAMGSGIKTKNFERIQEGYEISSQMTKRIKKLVLDILYYTKTRKFNGEKVSAQSFVKETLTIVKDSTTLNGITLKSFIEIDRKEDLLEVDRTSLQSALVNILENGVEACIADTSRKAHTLVFNASADNETITFLVQDTGQGMSKTTLKNIFTIFFSSKGANGTGLGLYIANKVIEQHRGTIKVRSKPGRGTRFVITIPRRIPDVTKQSMGLTPD
ncbi:Adh1 [Desulforapulum autotrophicum HRM2]|uniref:histidine kinase n=1 Tax=Desulforapulum autotrophicum (strain ATCC 43914 / DSM 3382 / VKM B-1955 / HRM2) TaxID=177437 RepID=C0Q8Y6_DESAH|nr:ATP-binding protein [Desulforapulum autotrophicum]ACN14476.1 Adh1 [Desulforapulum autotrophicum HRM2]